MEDFCLIKWVLCETCTRPCATLPENVKFKSPGGKFYCSEIHRRIHAKYLKLCAQARKKAKRFPKKEIDMSQAHAYWIKAREKYP